MTNFEIISVILLWLILGLFICYKAQWYEDWVGDDMVCVFVVIFAPIVFIFNFINLVFVKPWR